LPAPCLDISLPPAIPLHIDQGNLATSTCVSPVLACSILLLPSVTLQQSSKLATQGLKSIQKTCFVWSVEHS
jgi:hypothetical protein